MSPGSLQRPESKRSNSGNSDASVTAFLLFLIRFRRPENCDGAILINSPVPSHHSKSYPLLYPDTSFRLHKSWLHAGREDRFPGQELRSV
jgi:hypothetical protein